MEDMEDKYWRGDDTAKRNWFRFHLATAVSVVLCIGLFMWLNTRTYDVPVTWNGQRIGTITGQGFPLNFREHASGEGIHVPEGVIGINVVVSLAFTASVAYGVEFVLRRRRLHEP